MSDIARLRAAIDEAVSLLDSAEIGDEESVDQARGVLWNAYKPTCSATGWRKSDDDEVYCVLAENHEGDHDDGKNDDVEDWEIEA